MTKIEEVARAIAYSYAMDPDGPWDETQSHLRGLKNWQRFQVSARSAVEALKLQDDVEPLWLTRAPAEADVMGEDYPMAAHEASGAWNAMIDAILSEEP